MYSLVDSNFYRLKTSGRALGQDIDMLLYYQFHTGLGLDSQSVLANFASIWQAIIAIYISDDYAVTDYSLEHVFSIVTVPQPELVFDLYDALNGGAADAGGAGGDTLPTYVSVDVRKKTGGGATTVYFNPPVPAIPLERRFRGRIAFGPLTEAITVAGEGNTVEPASLTPLNAALQNLILLTFGAGGDTMQMVVPSLVRAGAVRPAGGGAFTFAAQPVTVLEGRPKVGSQVSRKAKV